VWGVVFLMALISISAGAEGALSLEQAFQLALKKNEDIRITEAQVAEARQNIRLARAAVLPGITAAFTQSRNREAGVGGFVTFKDNTDFRFDVSQPLYGGGKEWATLRAARVEVAVQQEEVRLVKQARLFEVAVEYFSLLRAQHRQTIARRAVELARDQLALAAARKEAGTATRTEVIRSEVALTAAERDVVRAENDVAVFRARLGFVVGRPVEGPVLDEPDPETDEARPDDKTPDPYVARAIRLRPEHRIAELRLKEAQEGIRTARAGFFPSAKLAGNYTRTQKVSSFREKDNWQVQAKVEYDIFDGFGRNAEVEKAEIRVEQHQLELERMAREIDLEVRQAMLEIDALRAIRAASRKGVGAARENYERVIAQFREGLSTAVEVADAHTALVAAEVQEADTDADLKLARRKFELALGELGTAE